MLKTVLLSILFAAGACAESSVTVIKQAAPEKALIFEVRIPATPAAVWEAFTTSEGA